MRAGTQRTLQFWRKLETLSHPYFAQKANLTRFVVFNEAKTPLFFHYRPRQLVHRKDEYIISKLSQEYNMRGFMHKTSEESHSSLTKWEAPLRSRTLGLRKAS
ncbi:unnamed protein product [Ceratitis capitata]|uniref:(Mediterranean fruit fly) hypothetical protein n=1 Tax=Ceratitis capitata TaxID=7213 RepID=A0A811VFD1_CERCA|nr:unnamed protein product [Ceratitis capitata]